MLTQLGILGGSAPTQPSDPSGPRCVAVPSGSDIPDPIDAVIRAGATPTELRAAEQLGARHTAILELLADAIDSREQFNPGSATRILEHATRFAAALGLSAADRVTFERGALLRDIGKLRVPNDVLLKHSVLTYDEWRLLQAHTVFGSDLALAVPGLGFIAPIARHHHENFDGTGYPEGLEGKRIPLLARAVKIIDVYCAMTSPRVYRVTFATREEAFEHLKCEREKFFDPELVEVFLNKNVADEVSTDSMAFAIRIEH
jgi:putative two-component system response regulator